MRRLLLIALVGVIVASFLVIRRGSSAPLFIVQATPTAPCNIEPRTTAELQAATIDAQATPLTVLAASSHHQPIHIGAAEITWSERGPRIRVGGETWTTEHILFRKQLGQFPDTLTVAGIDQTLHIWLECAALNDRARVASLFTPEGLRWVLLPGDPWEIGTTAAGWFLDPNQQASSLSRFEVHQLWQLSDERAVALIAEPVEQNADPMLSLPTSLWFFVSEEGVWRVEAIIGNLFLTLPIPTESTPTPIIVE